MIPHIKLAAALVAIITVARVVDVTSAVKPPKLTFHPNLLDEDSDNSLIWFSSGNRTSYEAWVNRANSFIDRYRTPRHNHYACSYDYTPPAHGVCTYDIRELSSECSSANYYGFHRGSPCIFLSLTKVNGWKPEYYGVDDELPKNMPPALRDQIQLLIATNPVMLQTLWVTCDGQNVHDQEFIGPVSFYPSNGFPGYYFPYTPEAEGYESPIIGFQLRRPTLGVAIGIECKAWAKNIVHDGTGAGKVYFELLID